MSDASEEQNSPGISMEAEANVDSDNQQSDKSKSVIIKTCLKSAWDVVERVRKDKCICKLSKFLDDGKACKALLATKSSSNKSILAHSKAFHNFDIKEYLETKKSNQSDTIRKFLSEKRFDQNWTPESAVSRLIAEKGVSLNFFENNFVMAKFFKSAFNQESPTRYIAKNHLKNHAQSIKNIIKEQLRKCQMVSISFDEWTSKSSIQVLNIIAFTAEETFNLGLIEVNTESANAESLTHLIREKLDEFGISKFPKVIIADGASVNQKISKLMNHRIQKCINHSIQLSICDIFYSKKVNAYNDCFDTSEDDNLEEEIDANMQPEDFTLTPTYATLFDGYSDRCIKVINKVRRIVKVFKKSPKNKRKLEKYTPLSLLIDVKTRWTSLEAMFTRFLDCFDHVRKASIDVSVEFDITDSEKQLIAEINSILKMSTAAIKMMSKRNANLNTCDLVMSKLIMDVKSLKNNNVAKDYASNVEKRYRERRTSLSDFLAYLLQYKIDQGENIFFKKDEIDFVDMESAFEEFNLKNLDENTNEEPASKRSAIDLSLNIDLDEQLTSNKTNSFNSFIRNFEISKTLCSNLKQFCYNLLSVKPTSTDNERTFSLANIILVPRRLRLKIELVNDIIIINKFYKNYFFLNIFFAYTRLLSRIPEI